jgi:hypothetical protein
MKSVKPRMPFGDTFELLAFRVGGSGLEQGQSPIDDKSRREESHRDVLLCPLLSLGSSSSQVAWLISESYIAIYPSMYSSRSDE